MQSGLQAGLTLNLRQRLRMPRSLHIAALLAVVVLASGTTLSTIAGTLISNSLTCLLPFPGEVDLTGYVGRISELKDGRVLVRAREGLFVLAAGAKTLEPAGAPHLTSYVGNITELKDGRVLVTAEKGWFVLAAGAKTLEPAGAPHLTGDVVGITELKDGRVLARAQKGLFVLGSDNFAKVLTNFIDLPNTPSLDQTIAIGLEVTSPCAETVGLWKPRLRVSKSENPTEHLSFAPLNSAHSSRLSFLYKFASPGAYELQLVVGAEDTPIGGMKKVVAGDLSDLVRYYAGYGAAALALLHFVVVAGLLIGARWSANCSRIVQDPIWSKAGVYINFLMRHWRPLQLWLLDRYFIDARDKLHETPAEPFEPLPATLDDRTVSLADADLLNVLKQQRHVWIHGRTGMGKTALVRALERTYFSVDQPDLLPSAFAAYRRWGRLLVFVSARRYESVPADADAPEKWVVKIVSRRLAHFGLEFSSEEMVRTLLQRGTLGVVIDGVDEVEKEDQVALFASVSPNTAVLATSQTEAKHSFKTWRLPTDIREHVGKLLRAHLGEADGVRLERYLCESCPALLENPLSGYDIRLVIDLARSRIDSPKLPSTRTGLYQAILDAIGPAYPLEDLGTLAWKMWLTGQRELPRDETIKQRIVRPLDQENRKVIRRLSGDRFEFRHDQMRAYLAAKWLVGQAANAETMLVHLKAESVWQVAARDQEEVWPFVAASLPSALLSPVWNFTVIDKARFHLEHELYKEAVRRQVALEMVTPVAAIT